MTKAREEEEESQEERPGFKRILVAVDGSKNAERAVQTAAELAKKFDSDHRAPRRFRAALPLQRHVSDANSTTPRRLQPVPTPGG